MPRSYLFDKVKDNSSISKNFYQMFPYLDQKNSFFNQSFKVQKKSLFSRYWKGKFPLKRLKKVNDFVQFIRENDSFLNPDDVASSILRLGGQLSREKYYTLSNKVLGTIMGDQYSQEMQDHFFLYFWNMILSNDYKKSFQMLEKFKVYDHFDFLYPKFKYWISHILQQNNETSLRDFYLKELILEHPLNFYSILAHLKLDSEKKNPALPFPSSYLSSSSESNEQVSNATSKYQDELKRIYLWSENGSTKLLMSEVNSLFQRIKENHQDESTTLNLSILKIIETLDTTENFLANFSFIQKIVYRHEELFHSKYLKFLFPKPFSKEVKEYSTKIDPLLVTSLMRQESAFNPEAISSAGAMGLMQLMPATARTLAKVKSTKSLHEPKKNITIGTKFLKKLLDKYEGNIVYSLAAYNAGQRRVKSWKRRGLFDGPLLKQIENIPFDETRKYVKLIMRNLFFYQYLNEKNSASSSIKAALDIKTKM